MQFLPCSFTLSSADRHITAGLSLYPTVVHTLKETSQVWRVKEPPPPTRLLSLSRLSLSLFRIASLHLFLTKWSHTKVYSKKILALWDKLVKYYTVPLCGWNLGNVHVVLLSVDHMHPLVQNSQCVQAKSRNTQLKTRSDRKPCKEKYVWTNDLKSVLGPRLPILSFWLTYRLFNNH